LKYTFRDVLADILSSLKLGGSGVSVALRVAPLGVSVLPLHASLSACNLDMPLSTALGAGCGGIPNRSWTGFVVGVSCMPSPKGLFAGLSTRDYDITVHICFLQFISSLKVGAFLLFYVREVRAVGALPINPRVLRLCAAGFEMPGIASRPTRHVIRADRSAW